MLNSKAILSSLAGFALVGAMTSTASAQAEPPAPAPETECAVGYSLVSVDAAKDQERAKQADGNNDQHVCEKTKDGKHTYADNKKKKKP
jgi:hypothetical protein